MNAGAGTESAVVGSGSGSFGKSLERERSQVEARRARDHLHVLLGRPVLHRNGVLWQRAGDVQEQPARHDHRALGADLRIEAGADAEVGVGRVQLGAPALQTDQHAGKRLNRAASRCAAGNYR
jgi:hypothetical protein